MSFETTALIVLGIPSSGIVLYCFYGMWVVGRAEKRERERLGVTPAE